MSKKYGKTEERGEETVAELNIAKNELRSGAKLNVKSEKAEKPVSHDVLPFGRKNYILLGVGIAILILGYVLLAGEKFIDAADKDHFSIALNVAPVIILAGYAEIIYAIMARDKKAN